MNECIEVPFNLELAKKITNNEVGGRVVTRDGRSTRIICFDAKRDDNIIVLINNGNEFEQVHSYASDGRLFINQESDNDLRIEIFKHNEFKDGDILYTKSSRCKCVFIYNSSTKDKTTGYALLDIVDNILYLDTKVDDNSNIEELRKATEKEAQILINTLEKDTRPKAKEYLRIFFGIDRRDFKPFDKVLVRNNDKSVWSTNFFSHKIEENGYVRYFCCGHSYDYCIPYNESTSYLCGTKLYYK